MTSSGSRYGTGATTDLVTLLRTLSAQETVDEAMRRLTAYTVERVRAAEAAGLTVDTVAGPATRAATAGLVGTVDALQYQLGGPCVAALLETDRIQHAKDLEAEDRWPEFAGAAVAQTPVRALLSYRLAVDDKQPVASLNLYATRPHAFTSHVVRDTGELAAQATVALAYVHERQTRRQLERALDSNRTIGAAAGVLMGRRGIRHEEAVALLRKASQDTNRTMGVVAEHVLEVGDLPLQTREAAIRASGPRTVTDEMTR